MKGEMLIVSPSLPLFVVVLSFGTVKNVTPLLLGATLNTAIYLK